MFNGLLPITAYTPLTIKNGSRSSAATSYLEPEVLKRSNLHVLVNAHVTKVTKTGDSEEGPIFQGVEFIMNKDLGEFLPR